MHLLVDTSAYIALLDAHPAIAGETRQADLLFLTPVALGELLAGYRKGTRYDENVTLLERFLASPRVSLLPIDEETANRYSIIHDWLRRAGTPLPANDVWIAASAFQHGLRVVTTDRHFERIPQIVTSYHPP